ncbi:IS66-like element accessory protein TnpA [Rhizobium sp. LjRoot258]|jgi:transposase|uniref:IS66-like element accessory protein TnpA n=1 Tax=Rhizobium sp. LjRoot258 TaxID=3342299 RepID=UPI003ECD9764
MTITGFTHSTKADEPVQRFEVFTGSGRRRDWSDKEKDRIIAESYTGERSVSTVARQHGLSPGQLFTWRRLARKPLDAVADHVPMFVPAAVDVRREPKESETDAFAEETI